MPRALHSHSQATPLYRIWFSHCKPRNLCRVYFRILLRDQVPRRLQGNGLPNCVELAHNLSIFQMTRVTPSNLNVV